MAATITPETSPIGETGWGSIDTMLAEVTDRTPVALNDPNLEAIERLRFLRDGYRLEVSYCYGRMTDGSLRRVVLNENLFTLKNHRARLVGLAKATDRFIPGLLENISIY